MCWYDVTLSNLATQGLNWHSIEREASCKCTFLVVIDKLRFILDSQYKNNSTKYYSNICFLSILSLDTNFLKSSVERIISTTFSREKPKKLLSPSLVLWAVLNDSKYFQIHIQKENILVRKLCKLLSFYFQYSSTYRKFHFFCTNRKR